VFFVKLAVCWFIAGLPLACVSDGGMPAGREPVTQSAEDAATETGGGQDTPEPQEVAVFP
jgi:hypothetical protein